jgi:hypothetical protein
MVEFSIQLRSFYNWQGILYQILPGNSMSMLEFGMFSTHTAYLVHSLFNMDCNPLYCINSFKTIAFITND